MSSKGEIVDIRSFCILHIKIGMSAALALKAMACAPAQRHHRICHRALSCLARHGLTTHQKEICLAPEGGEFVVVISLCWLHATTSDIVQLQQSTINGVLFLLTQVRASSRYYHAHYVQVGTILSKGDQTAAHNIRGFIYRPMRLQLAYVCRHSEPVTHLPLSALHGIRLLGPRSF